MDMRVGGHACAEVESMRKKQVTPKLFQTLQEGGGSIPDPILNVVLLMLGISFPKESRQRNELLF